MIAMTIRALTVLGASGLLLAGCLSGERPRISELYGDPLSQAPVASGSAMTSSSTTQTQQTVEVFGPPGTTVYSGVYPETYPAYGSAYPVYRNQPPPRRLPNGDPRYTFPQNDVRCDNATQRCGRWSGPRGRYVYDPAASRNVYGNPSRSVRLQVQP